MIDKLVVNMRQDSAPPQYETVPSPTENPAMAEKRRHIEERTANDSATNPFETRTVASTSRTPAFPPSQSTDSPSRAATEKEKEWFLVLNELQTDLADLRRKEKSIKLVNMFVGRCPSAYRPKGERLNERRVDEARALERRIQRNMEQLSRIHPDPLVQAEWAGRAQAFAHMIEAEKKGELPSEGNAAMLFVCLGRNKLSSYVTLYRERVDASGLGERGSPRRWNPVRSRGLSYCDPGFYTLWAGKDFRGAWPLFDARSSPQVDAEIFLYNCRCSLRYRHCNYNSPIRCQRKILNPHRLDSK